MILRIIKLLYALSVPWALPLVAVGVYLGRGTTPESLSTIVQVYPYLVFGSGILLGWRFNRSTAVFALVILALADRALLHFPLKPGSEADVGHVVFTFISFLLPINFLALSMTKERGLLSLKGMTFLGLIFLQLLGVAFIGYSKPAGMIVFINHKLVDGRFFTWTPIPQLALLVMGSALLLFLTRFFLYRKVMETGFFWALIASAIALAVNGGGKITTLYFSTGGLILVISIIEVSYAMAYRDELTGLPARRALKEFLLNLGGQYTIAMVDVDYFKKFNDRYGHDVGDQVLRMIASKLAKMSGGGKVFRYGGEEFTAVFPGKPADVALPHLEQLRKTVEASKFTLRGKNRPRKKPENPKLGSNRRKKLSVTVSIGVAERDGANTVPDQVIKAADRALYRAKNSGRNRVSG